MNPVRLPLLPLLVLLAACPGLRVRAQAPADAATRVNIQMTELGCLRALLVLDQLSLPVERRIAQRLTEVDFRVFPAANAGGARLTPALARRLGEEEGADLLLHASVELREKRALEDFKLFEGEATVQIWNIISGELIATQSLRATGPRTTDEVEARRGAVERSVDEACRAAIQQCLAKAHKILAHEAVVVNVFSESALLAIMEHVGRMQGVYHVRRRSFDRRTNEALLEIIAAPHSETTWRAYLEKMPKTKVNFSLNPNEQIHQKYPSWFLPAGSP